jgi:hypothetical protein
MTKVQRYSIAAIKSNGCTWSTTVDGVYGDVLARLGTAAIESRQEASECASDAPMVVAIICGPLPTTSVYTAFDAVAIERLERQFAK